MIDSRHSAHNDVADVCGRVEDNTHTPQTLNPKGFKVMKPGDFSQFL